MWYSLMRRNDVHVDKRLTSHLRVNVAPSLVRVVAVELKVEALTQPRDAHDDKELTEEDLDGKSASIN